MMSDGTVGPQQETCHQSPRDSRGLFLRGFLAWPLLVEQYG